jgi:hypothetical protein
VVFYFVAQLFPPPLTRLLVAQRGLELAEKLDTSRHDEAAQSNSYVAGKVLHGKQLNLGLEKVPARRIRALCVTSKQAAN